MEILIQSVLQNVRKFGSSVYIRYFERKEEPMDKSGNGKNGKAVDHPEKSEEIRTTSYVIIHEPYTYLEAVVRSMFGEAEDVEVIVDRRIRERREVSGAPEIPNRRKHRDRRQAAPMLDILINVN